ncbi:hypothetical protein [Psychrobacter sp. KCTC 72983]
MDWFNKTRLHSTIVYMSPLNLKSGITIILIC